MSVQPSPSAPLHLPGDGPLVLLGCGNMGSAMLRGWLAAALAPGRIVVQEPQPSDDLAAMLDAYGVQLTDAYAGPAPSVILAAVKPQVMDEVFPPVAQHATADTLVVSVAAGRTLASFEAHLPDVTGVVRTIPNTPSAIGQGMTVCVANAHVTAARREACTALLQAIGAVGWVEDEALIDVATGVSGSGPAYVFLMAEAMAAAGVKLGLPEPLAMQLAQQTIAGSGALMLAEMAAPDQLRRNVTSPNGTTAAALEVLMADSDGLAALMARGITASADRSRALAS
ncbi:MAG: pyrroline-5-carboxylate reductase [Pseudomonadota bacterium]